MILHPHPEPGNPSKAAIREYIRALDRAAARGERLTDLDEVLPDAVERAALFVLLSGRPDAARTAERQSPGVLARLHAFATEGGR